MVAWLKVVAVEGTRSGQKYVSEERDDAVFLAWARGRVESLYKLRGGRQQEEPLWGEGGDARSLVLHV